MQNFHWEYVFGISCFLLMGLMAARELRALAGRRRWLAPAVAVVVALHLASGLGLRALESYRCRITREVMADYGRYRAQGARPDAPALGRGSVVAGEAGYVDLAVILQDVRPLMHASVLVTPWMRDDEWHERIALNEFLRGLDRPAFEAQQRGAMVGGFSKMDLMGFGGGFGPWSRDPVRCEELIARRLAAYDAIRAAPPSAMDRYAVRYVALAEGTRPAYLDGGWRLLQAGPRWELWERADAGRVATARRGHARGPASP
jgi:hypothetical protein